MTDRMFVYVDGESHFIRSENAWRSLHGEEACLGRLRYVGQPDDRLTLFLPKAKVFWTRKMNPAAQRSIYFTAAAGDDVARHEIKVRLRDFGLEPSVLEEVGTLAKHRKNVLKTDKLIEKPQGVDIALAVAMLEHACHQAFDVCHLYTSDVDFLPVHPIYIFFFLPTLSRGQDWADSSGILLLWWAASEMGAADEFGATYRQFLRRESNHERDGVGIRGVRDGPHVVRDRTRRSDLPGHASWVLRNARWTACVWACIDQAV